MDDKQIDQAIFSSISSSGYHFVCLFEESVVVLFFSQEPNSVVIYTCVYVFMFLYKKGVWYFLFSYNTRFSFVKCKTTSCLCYCRGCISTTSTNLQIRRRYTVKYWKRRIMNVFMIAIVLFMVVINSGMVMAQGMYCILFLLSRLFSFLG